MSDHGDLRIERLGPDNERDFLALMGRDEHGGQCWCVAWWVPDWPTYQANTPEQNRAVRDDLLARDARDGYLGYVGGAPVGWMQTVRRDDVPKIAQTMQLEPDPDAWAVSCFTVLDGFRGQGLGRRMFAAVLDDLRERGVRVVEGYPRLGEIGEAAELWTGPRTLFVDHGFERVGGSPRFAVYRREL